MKTQSIHRDERTTAVENASYRLAYLLLSFGVLLSVAWRAFARQDSGWELLALVMVSGFAATFYQGIQRVLTRHTALLAVVTVMVAAALAAGIMLLR